jgi:hypothetical protein
MSDNMAEMVDAPVFDFDNISWRDEKAKSVAMARLIKAEKDGDVEAIASAFTDIEGYLAKCLVSVPSDWMVKNAPAQLDWSDVGAFAYLKGNKFQSLLIALRDAQTDIQKK